MAGSEEDSIRDLLKAYIPREADLRDIVLKLLGDGFNVHTLITMSDSNLDCLILRYFPVGSSMGAKIGFETAIRGRKEPTHGSSSTTLRDEEDERLGKVLAKVLAKVLPKVLDEREDKRKVKVPLAISSINTYQWGTLDLGLTVSMEIFDYTPTRMSDLPAFGWGDGSKASQWHRYMPHLNRIRRPREYSFFNANSKRNLLSGMLGGYSMRGTTDVAIIMKDQAAYPEAVLQCIFELKKANPQTGKVQVLAALVMANIVSRRWRPFAVLTDLVDAWHLYWMDGSRIHYSVMGSRAVAIGSIEDLLSVSADDSGGPSVLSSTGAEGGTLMNQIRSREAYVPTEAAGDSGGSGRSLFSQIAKAAGGSGDSGGSVFSQIAKRQKYIPPGVENIEELAGFIPESEILEARLEAGERHLLQLLQMPQFAAEDQTTYLHEVPSQYGELEADAL